MVSSGFKIYATYVRIALPFFKYTSALKMYQPPNKRFTFLKKEFAPFIHWFNPCHEYLEDSC